VLPLVDTDNTENKRDNEKIDVKEVHK